MSTAFPAALLCDLDGTLIASHDLWIEGDRAILETHGYTLDNEQVSIALEHLDGTAGVRRYIQRLFELTGAQLDEDWFHAQVEAYVTPRLTQAAWIPGAAELLSAAAGLGVPTGLVTNVKRAAVNAWLSGHTHQFEATVAGDEVVNGKPDPEPYLTAARILGVDPAHCVALEDSDAGARSATEAGCRVVRVAGRVPSFMEVMEVVR